MSHAPHTPVKPALFASATRSLLGARSVPQAAFPPPFGREEATLGTNEHRRGSRLRVRGAARPASRLRPPSRTRPCLRAAPAQAPAAACASPPVARARREQRRARRHAQAELAAW